MVKRVKNLPAMGETWVQSLGWEDPLEKGMATHSSILAWRIPWTEELGGLQSMGSQRVGHFQNVKDLLLKQSHCYGSGEAKTRKGEKDDRHTSSSCLLFEKWRCIGQNTRQLPLNEKILWKLKCLTILPAWNLFLDIYKMMTSSTITCQPFVKSRAIYFSCFYRLEICMNHFLNSKLPDSHLNLFLLISGTQLQRL